MDHVIDDTLAYAIADILEMRLAVRDTAPRLSGSALIPRKLAGAKINVKVEIVSSLINRTNHMVLARVMGNLAFLVVACQDRTRHLLMLNLAKLTEAPEKWLEFNQPTTVTAAQTLLDKAVVKRFVAGHKETWRAH